MGDKLISFKQTSGILAIIVGLSICADHFYKIPVIMILSLFLLGSFFWGFTYFSRHWIEINYLQKEQRLKYSALVQMFSVGIKAVTILMALALTNYTHIEQNDFFALLIFCSIASLIALFMVQNSSTLKSMNFLLNQKEFPTKFWSFDHVNKQFITDVTTKFFLMDGFMNSLKSALFVIGTLVAVQHNTKFFYLLEIIVAGISVYFLIASIVTSLSKTKLIFIYKLVCIGFAFAWICMAISLYFTLEETNKLISTLFIFLFTIFYAICIPIFASVKAALTTKSLALNANTVSQNIVLREGMLTFARVFGMGAAMIIATVLHKSQLILVLYCIIAIMVLFIPLEYKYTKKIM